MVKRCHNPWKNPCFFSVQCHLMPATAPCLTVTSPHDFALKLRDATKVISTMFQAAWEKLPGDSGTHNKNMHKVI